MLQLGTGGGTERREGRVPLKPPVFNMIFLLPCYLDISLGKVNPIRPIQGCAGCPFCSN